MLLLVAVVWALFYVLERERGLDRPTSFCVASLVCCTLQVCILLTRWLV